MASYGFNHVGNPDRNHLVRLTASILIGLIIWSVAWLFTTGLIAKRPRVGMMATPFLTAFVMAFATLAIYNMGDGIMFMNRNISVSLMAVLGSIATFLVWKSVVKEFPPQKT